MKNCPTCGQPILPSMGEKAARKVKNIETAHTQTPNIRTTRQNRPVENPQTGRTTPTLTLHIRANTGTGHQDSTFLPRTETTPRGYKTQQVVKIAGKRHKIRLNFTNFPRKGTIGGKITVVPLPRILKDGTEAQKMIHALPDLLKPEWLVELPGLAGPGNETIEMRVVLGGV